MNMSRTAAALTMIAVIVSGAFLTALTATAAPQTRPSSPGGYDKPTPSPSRSRWSPSPSNSPSKSPSASPSLPTPSGTESAPPSLPVTGPHAAGDTAAVGALSVGAGILLLAGVGMWQARRRER